MTDYIKGYQAYLVGERHGSFHPSMIIVFLKNDGSISSPYRAMHEDKETPLEGRLFPLFSKLFPQIRLNVTETEALTSRSPA